MKTYIINFLIETESNTQGETLTVCSDLKTAQKEFKKAVKGDREVYDFLIEKFVTENNIETAEGKKKISDEMLPLISNIKNEIVKEHYLKKLSEKIDTSYDSLIRQIENKNEKKEEEKFKKVSKQNRREVLEEYLLGLVLQSSDAKRILILAKDVLNVYKFEVPAIGKIFAEIISVIDAKEFDIKSISKNLSQELLPVFDKCYLMPLPKFDDVSIYEQEIVRVAKELKLLFLKQRIKEISKEIKGKEDTLSEVEKIKEEIASITAQIIS
jgi:DNA primase